MALCYIGLGSNLGERRKNLTAAVSMIGRLKNTKVLKRSRIIETAAVGGPAGQPDFLNAAVRIETSLSPVALFRELKRIERSLGRKRTVRNGPRTIDLDLLLYQGKTVNRRNLVVPHPRMYVRDFVLRPLSEIYEIDP